MNAWSAGLIFLFRVGLVVIVAWAAAVLALGTFLTRPRRTRRPAPAQPVERRPLNRDDFTLAA